MLAQCRGYELTKVTTADPLFSCEKREQTDGVNLVAISPMDPGVPVTSLFFTYSGPKHWFCQQILEDNGTQANKNIR